MLDDWPNFVQTLHTQFGPVDPAADTEDGINSLKMHDSQHIVKYNIECLMIGPTLSKLSTLSLVL